MTQVTDPKTDIPPLRRSDIYLVEGPPPQMVIDENVLDWGRASGASPRLVKSIRRALNKGSDSR